MWLPLKPLIVAFASVSLLSGCGFSPVYAKRDGGIGTTNQAEMASVEVAGIGRGREGQILRTALEDKLNPTNMQVPQAYILRVGLSSQHIPVSIGSDRAVARHQQDLMANVTLTRTSDQAEMVNTFVRRTVSYSVSQSDFATYAASQDVIQRGLEELAEDVAMRVSAALAHQGLEKPAEPALEQK